MSETALTAFDLAGVLVPGAGFDSIELHRGRTYLVLARDGDAEERAVDALAAHAPCAVVSSDGGLIANLTLRENLCLPLVYESADACPDAAGAGGELARATGFDADAFVAALDRQPHAVPLVMRRFAGFVRSMLLEPEMLVLVSPFDALGPQDRARVARFERVFHLYHPFRTVVFVDTDAAALPRLDIDAVIHAG